LGERADEDVMAAILARRSAALGLLALVSAALLVGCGHSAPAASGGTVIGVTEHDFHIATSISYVSAGTVTLRIHNNGPDQHELIVAPVRSGGLPIRPDGFTVNEDAIQNSEPGSINPQQSGGTTELSVHLGPGRYVLFCNMEGHYMSGMHTVLVVG